MGPLCPEEGSFRPRPIERKDYLTLQEKLQRGGLRGVGGLTVFDGG